MRDECFRSGVFRYGGDIGVGREQRVDAGPTRLVALRSSFPVYSELGFYFRSSAGSTWRTGQSYPWVHFL